MKTKKCWPAFSFPGLAQPLVGNRIFAILFVAILRYFKISVKIFVGIDEPACDGQALLWELFLITIEEERAQEKWPMNGVSGRLTVGSR